MPLIEFKALDYCADQRFASAQYRFDGDVDHGWQVWRDEVLALELGPGYRLLRARQCGVCSTDLARHHLPFPLPQVIGHEVLAVDEAGRRYVVEINASHEARGVESDCAFCREGLPTHCPDRLVLGIHDLPGGFGPWILAPEASCLEIPENVPDSAAVLVEPFAAALHAVSTVAPVEGDKVAVLGPRRLGMLVVAALAGVRTRDRVPSGSFEVIAVARDPAMLSLARSFGATAAYGNSSSDARIDDEAFDVVVDTTGSPAGLTDAVRMARREVHLKSTHGQMACGLRHLTELVVDELSIERFSVHPPSTKDQIWSGSPGRRRPRVAWLAEAAPPAWLLEMVDLRAGGARELADHFAAASSGLPRADVAVIDSIAQVDAVVRPRPESEEALIRPRGVIYAHPSTDVAGSDLLAAVVGRGLRLSSSRCGDFRKALELLASDEDLRRIGERLVTHHFESDDLMKAFEVAGSRACVKAVVTHDEDGGWS